MAKVEIDTPGVTIRIDDEPGGPELDARALALYRAAVASDVALPTGPASGGQIERRSSGNMGFGTWRREASTPEARDGNG